MWGAQHEVGAFPTSYIPTTGASATRSADYSPYMPLPYSPNNALGTLVANAAIGMPTLAATLTLACTSDGSTNNRWLLSVDTGSHAYQEGYIGGAYAAAAATANATALRTAFKVAGLLSSATAENTVLNGGAVQAGAISGSGAYTSGSLLQFSRSFGSMQAAQFWIGRIQRFHNYGFSNAQLQALTQ